MNNFKLLLPTKKYVSQIERFKNDMIAADSPMCGCGSLRRLDVNEWIKDCKKWKNGKNLPDGFVASTQYICIRKTDNKLVGVLQLRHNLTDYLLNFGGNIGYSVAIDERGKKICVKMLKLALKKAKNMGMKKVLITALDTNIASQKCIMANGGVYEDTRVDGDKKLQRYWIDLIGK